MSHLDVSVRLLATILGSAWVPAAEGGEDGGDDEMASAALPQMVEGGDADDGDEGGGDPSVTPASPCIYACTSFRWGALYPALKAYLKSESEREGRPLSDADADVEVLAVRRGLLGLTTGNAEWFLLRSDQVTTVAGDAVVGGVREGTEGTHSSALDDEASRPPQLAVTREQRTPARIAHLPLPDTRPLPMHGPVGAAAAVHYVVVAATGHAPTDAVLHQQERTLFPPMVGCPAAAAHRVPILMMPSSRRGVENDGPPLRMFLLNPALMYGALQEALASGAVGSRASAMQWMRRRGVVHQRPLAVFMDMCPDTKAILAAPPRRAATADDGGRISKPTAPIAVVFQGPTGTIPAGHPPAYAPDAVHDLLRQAKQRTLETLQLICTMQDQLGSPQGT